MDLNIGQDLNNVDSVYRSTAAKAFSTMMNITSYGDPNISNADQILQNNFPGVSNDDEAKFLNAFYDIEQKHTEYTNNALVANSLGAMNTFVADTQTTERDRLAGLSKKSSNDLFKMKQEYKNTKYSIEETKFNSRMVMWTFIFTIVGVSIMTLIIPIKTDVPPVLSLTIALVIVGCVLLVWIAVLVIMYRSKFGRRKDDWDKLIFTAKTE